MGLVLLDLTFRIEKGFGIQLGKGWWVDHLGLTLVPGEFRDISLEDLHAEILDECVRQGATPPADSWPLLVSFVVDASGLNASEVSPETMLLRDVTPHG